MNLIPLLTVPLVIVFDQVLKIWALANLDTTPDPWLPGLYLTLVHNSGAAFGILANATWILAWISLLVGSGILVWLGRARNLSWPTSLAASLVAGGALGNAIDRLARGEVIDYLDIGPGLWPVFNLADSAVVVGVAVFILESLLSGRRRF